MGIVHVFVNVPCHIKKDSETAFVNSRHVYLPVQATVPCFGYRHAHKQVQTIWKMSCQRTAIGHNKDTNHHTMTSCKCILHFHTFVPSTSRFVSHPQSCLAKERSSGVFAEKAQHKGQQIPITSCFENGISVFFVLSTMPITTTNN